MCGGSHRYKSSVKERPRAEAGIRSVGDGHQMVNWQTGRMTEWQLPPYELFMMPPKFWWMRRWLFCSLRRAATARVVKAIMAE